MVATPSLAGVAGTSSTHGSSRASPAVNSSTNHHAANGTKGRTSQANGHSLRPPNPQALLSSMRSAPLDLTSVERRGQPTASRESTKRNRPHGLQEAPTYRPSEEDWKDPLEYIRKITPEAKKYGVCKIIPPDSWNPDFAIDTEVCRRPPCSTGRLEPCFELAWPLRNSFCTC
jgi:[histone H3]-trimethyl-L-lysine4 demethylase